MGLDSEIVLVIEPFFLEVCLLTLEFAVPSFPGELPEDEPEVGGFVNVGLFEERCLFLITSVFKESGLTTPCNFKNNPHALHNGLPCGSLLHNGVVFVWQLVHLVSPLLADDDAVEDVPVLGTPTASFIVSWLFIDATDKLLLLELELFICFFLTELAAADLREF